MYWLQEGGTSSDDLSNVKGSLEYMNNLLSSIKKGLDPQYVEKFFLSLEQSATIANAKVTGQFKSFQADLQNTIFNVYSKNLKTLGFQQSEITDFVTTMATQLERAIPFTEEITKNALTLAKAMNVTAAEMGGYYATLIKTGLSQEASNQILTNVFEKGRKYGLDTKKLTETVTQNIQKAAMYGFKDGIDGLTRMAAQAQKLNIDISYASDAASKFRNIEDSVASAANLQMLGGAFAQFGDFFSMTNMALNDTEELQNQMGKVFSQYVEIDKETGQIRRSSSTAQLQMAEAAKEFNLSYEQAFDMGSKFYKENLFENFLKTTGLSEEQKSLVYTFGEMVKNKTGGFDLKVKLPGQDEMVDATKLTAEQLKQLEEAQKDSQKKPEEVAKDQLSVLRNIELTLKDIELSGARTAFTKKGETGKPISEELVDVNRYRTTQMDYSVLIKNMEAIDESILNTYTTTIKVANATFDDALKNSEPFITKMGEIIKIGIDAVGDLAEALGKILKGETTEGINETISAFKTASESLKTTFGDINIELNGLDGNFKNLFNTLKDGKTGLFEGLEENTKKYLGITGNDESMATPKNIIPEIPPSSIEKIQETALSIPTEGTINHKYEDQKITIEFTSNIPGIDKAYLEKFVDKNTLNAEIISTLNQIKTKDYTEQLTSQIID